MNASRAQLVREVIRPALAAGEIVLCDRFYDSTTAYQGYGRQLDLQMVKHIIDVAVGETRPDLTLLFAGAARGQRGAARGPPAHPALALQARPDRGGGPELLRARGQRLPGHRRRANRNGCGSSTRRAMLPQIQAAIWDLVQPLVARKCGSAEAS